MDRSLRWPAGFSPYGLLTLVVLIGVFVGVVSPDRMALALLVTVFCLGIVFFLPQQVRLVVGIGFLAVQNMLIPILLRLGVLHATSGFLLIIAGEIFVIVLITVGVAEKLLARNWNVVRTDYMAVVYGAVVLGYVLFPGEPFLAKMTSARTFLIPVVFYFLGRLCTEKSVEFVYRIGVVAAVIGLAIYPINVQFWSALDVGRYWVDVKHLPPTYLLYGLPADFTETYGVHTFSRLASIYGDPLGTAYALAPIAFIASIRWFVRKGSGWTVALVAAALIATVTKAAVGVLLGALLLALLRGKPFGFSRRRLSWYLFFIGGGMAMAFVPLILPIFQGTDVSLTTHGLEFATNISRLSWGSIIGAGLGGAGVIASSFGGRASGVGDAALLELFYEVGIPGLVTFLAFVIFTARDSITRGIQSYGSLLPMYLLTGMIAGELFTETAMGFFWLLGGFAVGASKGDLETWKW